MLTFKDCRLIFLLVFGLCAGSLTASQELPEIGQITTHPQMDFQPTVSPDGRWMAFVSSRSGNLDIWLKPLPRGGAIQITKDRSEDFQPRWMPDGKSLVFVSKRRDAMGDIWRVRIDGKTGKIKGKPEQITSHLGWDQSPCVSPDGRSIVYVSDMLGGLNLHIIKIKSRQILHLGIKNAVEPAWSPDGRWIVFTAFPASPYGDLTLADMQPFFEGGQPRLHVLTSGKTLDGQACWSPDGRWIVFQRIREDTNHDGQLTPEDHGSLWQKKIPDEMDAYLYTRPEFQLTTDIHHDMSPCWHDSLIYFTSLRGGGEDVWTLPEHGLIPYMSSVNRQYMAVFNRFGMVVTPPALLQAILAYRRVLTQFPEDSVWCARAWIRIGELQTFLKQYEQAKESFNTVRNNYSNWSEEVAEAAVKEASVPAGSVEERIELCRWISEHYSDEEFAANEARLLMGDLYEANGDIGSSITSYSSVIRSNSRYTSLVAQAKLKIGDLFKLQGQEETAQQSYLAVLREYGRTPLWRQRAIQRIMNQVHGDLSEKIAAYQDIQLKAADLPALMAEAQLAIGQALIDDEQYTEAIHELEQVDVIGPELKWAQAKSRLMQASAFNYLNDFLKAKLLLEEVIGQYGEVEGGLYRLEAEEQLFYLTFYSAESSKALQDFSLATARYRMALNIRPDDIRVHRGLIESAYYWQRLRKNGKLDSLIRDYERQLQQNSSQPIVQYSLGLALSYAGERDSKQLDASNAHLLAALEDDYRLIYPYRTLGYNYELMERLDQLKQQKQPGIFQRAGKVLFTPVRWISRLFTKRKNTGPVQYYEKAIEVLTTAIELNDEKNDPRLEAELAQNLANNFYNLGEYGFPRAYRYYRKRLSIDTTFHQPLEEAIFYSRTGHCALNLDEFQCAEKYLEHSIALYEKLNRESLKSQDLGRLAYLYQRNGKYQEAIDIYENLVKKNQYYQQWDAMIRNYRNIAYNYHLLWEPEDAIRYAEKAEQILATQNIPKGPPEKSYLRWEFFGLSIPLWGMEEIGASSSEGFTLAEEAALIYILVGKNAERLKDFAKALDCEEKRLEIFKNRKDALAQRISINRIGLLLMKQGQYEQAWQQFYTAYKMSRKAGDDPGRWMNVNNMAQVTMIQMSESGESVHLPVSRQLLLDEIEVDGTERSPKELGSVYSALGGMTYYEVRAEDKMRPDHPVQYTIARLQRLAEADLYFSKAMAFARQEGSWREEGILLKCRADVAMCSGDRESAAAMLNQAEFLFESRGETHYLWRVRYALAQLSSVFSQIRRDALRLKDPLWYFKSAIEGLEALPVMEEDSELNLADRSDRWNVYIDAAVAYTQANNPEMAFVLFERGKEKRLADVLARRPPKLRRERHKNLWQNLRDIRAQLGEVRKRILTLETDQTRQNELKALYERARFLNEEHAFFMADIEEEDQVLAYLSGASMIQMSDMQASLKAEQGALSYMIRPGGITIFLIDPDTLIIRQVPVHIDSLHDVVRQMNRRIQKNESLKSETELLSRWLVSSFSSWLGNKFHLIIIPDDVIWDVPFELLHLNGEPLNERVTLSMVPSLMAYQMAGSRRKINQSSLLVIGDPSDEALQDHVPQKTDLLLGMNAKESKCHQKMGTADLVHLERWMLPNEKSPLQAAIILFPDSGADGYIRPEELFGWNSSASFVKLPAPRLDPFHHSVELYYYALLYAGTPTVLFTRWAQTPEYRVPFFQSFYSELEHRSLSEALTLTQIRFKEQSRPERIWAAYGLIGFEGMNPDARLQFARSNLVSTVIAGRNYSKMREYRDAIGLYEQALEMAKSLKDTTSIRGVLLEIVRAGMQGEVWDKAIAYQQQFIEMFGNAENVQVAQQNLVSFYFQSGQFDAAAQAKIQALQQYRAEEQWQKVAEGAMELAVIFASARNYDASIQWADEAYRTYLSLDQNLGKARSLIWKGRSLLDAERFFEARAAFSLAIEMLEKDNAAQQRSNQVFELATAYQLRGICLENISLYRESLKDQHHALLLLKMIDRPLQLAQGRQYLANVTWKMGDYRTALAHQEEALKLFERQGQRKHLAMAYSTQGLIQMSLGEFARAKSSEEKAYELAQKIQSREDEATILKNMGQIAIHENNLDQAYQYFQQAATIDSGLGLKRGLSYDYRNQGMLLIQMRQFNSAIVKLKKGLTLTRSVQDLRNQVQCYYGLGLALFRMGQFDEALAFVDSGLVLTDRLVVPELEWRLHKQRGKIHWAKKKREEALSDFKAAVGIVEKMRAELKVEAFKQGFFDSKMELYQDMIQLLLETQQRALAFHYVERAKSRDFIDLLANQRLSIPETQRHLLEQENDLKTRIQEVRNRIAQHRETVGWGEQHSWEDSLQALMDNYESLMISIQANNPELASFVSVDPWTAEKLQSRLPEQAGLIEYYWGEKAGYCWIITSTDIKLAMINVKQEELGQTIQSLRESLIAHLSGDMESRLLYDWLISPISSYLDSLSHLIVIPHGALHYLPFAALQNDEGYLVERFSLSLAPSSTVLGYCLEKTMGSGEIDARSTVTAFGNPDLGDPKLDLAFADKEIVALERVFPDVTTYTRDSANEANVKKETGREKILHFACHATYEAGAPLFSSLLLSPSGDEDGHLEVHEIFGLRLQCDLVTLSACETGLGTITGGDEIIGLSRSFIYAGTPSILTSLWKVDDLATAVMMKRFYRYLAAGQSRAKALQQAQLVIRDLVNPHPSAWAAFNITGDFR